MLISIEEAIARIKDGKMVILVDDENRENEGDLVIAAQHVTPELINFMAKYARGLICAPIDVERAHKLALPPMAPENTALHGTRFTVSVDARHGITTGISAQDRARTVRVMIDDAATPEDLARPGHVFPLRLSPDRSGGRGTEARRPHRGCGRSRPPGWTQAGGGDLRGDERRRHDGAPPAAEGVRRPT